MWLLAAPLWATECLPFRADEWVRVDRVFDGDTVQLGDGRKVRLIGINTPEIGRDGAPSEPLAEEARQALIALLGETRRLALRYEQEREDRYGRLLAHAFLPDRRNLQYLLLQQGLAAAVAVAPNLDNLQCYLAAEGEAQGRGLWRLPAWQGVETTALPAGSGGFHVLRGRVVRIGESRHAWWINLAGGVAARVDKRDLHRFEGRLALRSLAGRTIRLRGWLYRVRGEARLNLSHPALVELLE